MHSLPSARPGQLQTGYWGNHDGTIDFCEENYQVSRFINTISNAPTVLLPLVGIYHAYKERMPKRTYICHIGIAIIGVGSALFHATLQHRFQILDEVPMMWATSILFWCSFETAPGYGRSIVNSFTILLALFNIVITITCVYQLSPTIHEIAFGILAFGSAGRIIYILLSDERLPKNDTIRGQAQGLYAVGVISGVIGFIIWNFDNLACETLLKPWKARLGLPSAFILEGHGYWHILTALSAASSNDGEVKRLSLVGNQESSRHYMSFKKPPSSISTHAPIKSSLRRNIVSAVASQFDISPDEAKSLVPEGIQAAKFLTHLDAPGTLYFSPSSTPSTPLWFVFGKTPSFDKLIPSLHTLIQHPSLLPAIYTHPHVITRLINGADLMMPGLADSLKEEDLKEGDLIAVWATGCKVPLGIGYLALDGKLIKRGTKGKAVEMVHCWKDPLWNLCKAPADVPFQLPGSDDEFESEEEDVPSSGTDQIVSQIQNVSLEPSPSKTDEPAPSEPTLTATEVDTILRLALLQLITVLKENPPPPGTFPIASSTFYEKHLLPNRPVWAPSSQAIVQKSTFKKVSKWVKAMEKESLLKTKSQKDQDLILSVDVNHAAVSTFAPHRTTGELEAREKKKAATAAIPGPGGSSGTTQAGTMTVKELFRPAGKNVAFWTKREISSSQTLTYPEIKTHVLDYITIANLTHPVQQAFVNLDETLAQACLKKGEKVDFMKKVDVVDRIRDGMTALSSLGEDGALKAGSLRPVLITKKKRANKHITLISGLETFSIEPKTFSESLKKLCAGSTSVSPLQSASPKATLSEVMVQGTHDKLIVDLLIELGVPRKWTKVVKA
ncbi:Filamentous baseplate protein Ligatin, contains PUA domain [Phaffia rhodozyma]|uniref:Filamentous baseplate protein Ligatin, contains PUA domain n=1 Tax=Phaffia rhodozyma TaxID=264483 RepID=A0A0F7SGV7_PHARH|nr:Filamentous baseplate protein Ligatin, contains PUA domain [Phaffia rhodozyma]